MSDSEEYYDNIHVFKMIWWIMNENWGKSSFLSHGQEKNFSSYWKINWTKIQACALFSPKLAHDTQRVHLYASSRSYFEFMRYINISLTCPLLLWGLIYRKLQIAGILLALAQCFFKCFPTCRTQISSKMFLLHHVWKYELIFAGVWLKSCALVFHLISLLIGCNNEH